MTRKSWYSLALFLPILLPAFWLAASGAGMALHAIDATTSRHLTTWIGLMVAALLFGGVQYFLFSIAVVLWMMPRTAGQISRVGWLLPLLFYPVCSAGLSVMASIVWPMSASLAFGFLSGLLCIPTGYVYMVTLCGLTWLFTRLHIIEGPYAAA